jgi:hypothetical protein
MFIKLNCRTHAVVLICVFNWNAPSSLLREISFLKHVFSYYKMKY